VILFFILFSGVKCSARVVSDINKVVLCSAWVPIFDKF